jgi:uncharacterized protein YjbI with pentapeptide repeats
MRQPAGPNCWRQEGNGMRRGQALTERLARTRASLKDTVTKLWAPWWFRVVCVLIVTTAIGLLIWAGYRASWTGFKGRFIVGGEYQATKTLWDWMDLLLVPLLLALGAWFLNRTARKREYETELDRSRDAALQTCLDRVSVLLRSTWRESERGFLEANIIRAQITTALRQLDGRRNGLLIGFLLESGLLVKKSAVVLSETDLTGVDLSGADLSFADFHQTNLTQAKLDRTLLIEADLSGAIVSGADLTQADLSGADLNGADLFEANLTEATLTSADLSNADLGKANLVGVSLYKARLKGVKLDEDTHLDAKWRLAWAIVNQREVKRDLAGADLRLTDLSGVDLSGADLSRADLSRANLTGASLANADLSEANLTEAFLRGANLSAADLSGADLGGAFLEKANVTQQQLGLAKNLRHAVWSEGTEQQRSP